MEKREGEMERTRQWGSKVVGRAAEDGTRAKRNRGVAIIVEG